jgi:peptidoglycan-binding protein ArfA
MRGPLQQCPLLAAIAGGVCLACVTGCAAFANQDSSVGNPRHQVSGQIVYRHYQYRQLGTGEEAHFARCVSPVCPAITPKTLALLGNDSRSTSVHPARIADVSSSGKVEDQLETVIVHFAPGSASLGQQARSTLSQFADVVRQSTRIVVRGRTDSTGSGTVNRRLAEERAYSVARFLRDGLAAPHGRIEIEARGRCCYAASNEVASGRQLNRRVEISFYPPIKEFP